MKPLQEAIEYFTNQIVKRTSKSFANSKMSKQDFDEILNSTDTIKKITNKIEKEGNENGGNKDNQKSD